MNARKDMLDPSQIDAIEGRLAGTLKPVAPPTDFVQRLRGHIHVPVGEEIAFRLQDWERVVMVLTGVLSGTVVVVAFARAMYHLFGRRNG